MAQRTGNGFVPISNHQDQHATSKFSQISVDTCIQVILPAISTWPFIFFLHLFSVYLVSGRFSGKPGSASGPSVYWLLIVIRDAGYPTNSVKILKET